MSIVKQSLGFLVVQIFLNKIFTAKNMCAKFILDDYDLSLAQFQSVSMNPKESIKFQMLS